METSILAALIPVVSGAISALFWALMKEKDRSILHIQETLRKSEEKWEKERSDLLAKVDSLQNIIGRNTDILERVAETMSNQEQLHRYSLHQSKEVQSPSRTSQ